MEREQTMCIQDFLDGHAEAAIWLAWDAATADYPDGPEHYDWGSGPVDGLIRDELLSLTDSARIELDRDAREFYSDHLNLLPDGVDRRQLGHDFWMSREGHGTGFWDRGYPKGDELHAGSKPYGEGPMLWVDDEDGTIHT